MSPVAKKQIHFSFDLSYIHTDGRWRTPHSWPGRHFPDVEMYEELARIAERGLFDMLFCGDSTGVPDTYQGTMDAAVHWGTSWPRQDFNPIAVAMSRVTQRLGFGLTYASTFMHPYYMARLMNSLDHVTRGRIAMNVITSTRRADAANYGFDELMEHGARYDRMEEFIDVCKALWESVGSDTMVWDHATGQVGDPSKIHAINHEGRFFKVRGPLNTPPSPQGRPVILQAGASPRGIRAAAHVADHVFGGERPLPRQVQQRKDLDAALLAEGRDPESVGIYWATPLIVAETEAEAKAERELLVDMVPREAMAAHMSYNMGYDLSKLPERFSLTALNEEIAATGASPVGMMYGLALQLGKDAIITRDEFFHHCALTATSYEHTIAGTPAQIADILEERFAATGSRGGFMLGHPVAMPHDLIRIVDLLVPELQRRGVYRKEYRYTTMRENMAEY
jgi:FMN-dependent oxidoreductase (nitrilotriacetate monooxygenase family)